MPFCFAADCKKKKKLSGKTLITEGVLPHTSKKRMLYGKAKKTLLGFSTRSISIRSYPFCPSYFDMVMSCLYNKVSIKPQKDRVRKA